MKLNLFLALLSLLSCVNLSTAATIDLEQEYRKLDKAIEQSERYVQERESRIQGFKSARKATDDARVQYDLNRSLYEEYRPYMSDSAIHYIGRKI